MDRQYQQQRIAAGQDLLSGYADLLLAHLPAGQQRADLLAAAQQRMRSYVQMDRELTEWSAAVPLARDQVISGDGPGAEVDLKQLHDSVRKLADQRLAKLPADFVEQNAAYTALQERLASAADGDDTGELQMTETCGAVLDPWSKQPIQQAYRNRNCRHLYSYQSLESALGRPGSKARRPARPVLCPYVGCANKVPLHWDHLTQHQSTQPSL